MPEVVAVRTSRFLSLSFALLLSLSACADDDEPTPSPAPSPSATPSATATAGPTPTAGPTSTGTPAPTTSRPPVSTSTVSVYLLKGEDLQPVARTATGTGVAAAAVRALLSGPSTAEHSDGLTSNVPSGTTLRGLTIRDGLATVDLSGRFDDGGGTLSMTSRVAQVVFTLTRFPTVDRVVFMLDGKRVTSLGGEGVDLSRPVDRDDYESLSPAVLIETPRWGESARMPLRVTGTANVFEAVFFLELENARGRRLVEQRVMATSGSGTRGTFDVTLRGTLSGAVLLNAFVYSAKDGSREDVVSVPLTLAAP